MLAWLVGITHYDFEISSLNCELGRSGPLECLSTFDFGGLKYLRLYFENNYLRNPYGFFMDLKVLERLQNLPNLENFLLDESYRSDSSSIIRALIHILGSRPASRPEIELILSNPRYIPRSLLKIHSTTNVLQKLRDKQWPRLRHLDLPSLNTTVAGFQAFTKPHAGSLKSFQFYNQLRCANEKVEEEKQRRELMHWIQTVLCPQGGGTKVKLVNQVEGYYGDEYWEGNAAEQGGLSEDTIQEN